MRLRAFQWDIYSRMNSQGIRCNDIYVWGHNEEEETCLLKIRGYHSTMYIELPDEYTETQAKAVCMWLQLRFPDEIVGTKFCRKKKLYGAYVDDKTYPHILVSIYYERSIFNITKVLDQEINVPGLGEIRVLHHESNIATVLKFQTEKGLEMSGWLEVLNPNEESSDDAKTGLPEYWALHSVIKAVDDEGYRDKIIPCKILSFDHEAYSERASQMPNKDNWKDVIFMTGITTKTYQREDTVKKYIFMTYKRPDFGAKKAKYIEPPFTKEQVREHVRKDIAIKWFNSERDLIHGMERFFVEYDPDVVIGYNILGFDYMYTHYRLDRLKDQHHQMGRIMGIPPKWKEQEWSSGAYGKQKFGFLIMQGRITIDMLPVMKREHKLPKYSLDYVSEKFLGERKEDVDFKEIFAYYKSDDPELHAKIANYCSTDTELPIKLFEKFHVWPSVVVTSCIVDVSINDLYTRGQQLRGYNQIYRLATKDNIVVRFTPKSDDESLADLLNEDGDDADGGDDDADDADPDAPKKKKAVAAKKDQKYSGATVVEPIVGLHEDVISFDFKSLYPSIQRAYNICYTTFIPDGVYVPESRVITMEWDDPKDNEHYKFRWIKDRAGIVPQLLNHLVDQRDAARAAIKKTDDESLKVVLDMRQLQLKVSANSMYGMMGVKPGRAYLPLREGAQCVTYVGRTTIGATINKIQDIDVGVIRQRITGADTVVPLKPDGVTEFPAQKNITVYGDTDSCMVKLGLRDGDPGFEIGEEIAKYITKTLPPPMKLESENWFARYLIITKKRYAAIKRTDRDDPKRGLKKGDAMLDINDQYKRGLADARRDNCKYLRETCTTTLRKIMLLEDEHSIGDYVRARCFELLYQNVPYEDLMISTAINKEKYKSESAFQGCLANALRLRGFDIRVGDRIEYFFKWVPDLPGVKILKADYSEVVETIKTDRASVHIDYEKYVEKQLQKPIDQLTNVRFKQEFVKQILVVMKARKKMLDELVGLYAGLTRLNFNFLGKS